MAIIVQFEIDEKGGIKDIRQINKELRDTEKAGGEAEKGIKRLSTGIKALVGIELTRFLADATHHATRLGKAILNNSANFERLQISLDTITKGRGMEWFNKLNEWALKMPVNTEKAIETFQMLRAMGLKPTIEQMTILVDTTSALGGRTETLTGIALAMGQIATKGKLQAQEIRQLAERGIPAYEILKEKIGLTGEAIDQTGGKMIKADKVLKALFEGMEERFAGQSEKIRQSLGGITVEIMSLGKEWARLFMEGGPLERVKDIGKGIRDILQDIVDAGKEAKYLEGAKDYLRTQGIKPTEVYEFEATGIGINLEGGRYRKRDAFTPEQLAKYDDYLKKLEEVNNANKALYEANRKRDKDELDAIVARSEAERKAMSQHFHDLAFGEMVEGMIAKEDEERWEAHKEYYKDIQKEYEAYKDEMHRLDVEGYELQAAVLEEIADKQAYEMQQMENSVVSFAQTWGSMLYNAQQQAGNTFDNIKKMVKNLTEQMAVQAGVAAIAAPFFGMTPGAGIGATLKGFFGFRAGGGDVRAGGIYSINEREPEFFRPHTSGEVIPLSKMVTNDNRIGDINVQVINQSGTLDPQQVADAIEEAVYLRKLNMQAG